MKLDRKIEERLRRSRYNIQQAQYKLDHTLFGHLLSAVPLLEVRDEPGDPDLACIDASQGVIWVNPWGKKVLSVEEWTFILAHQLLHLGLNHRTKMEERDPNLWNLACEIAIDNLLHSFGYRTHPECCHVDVRLSKLCEEDIYEELAINPRVLDDFQTFAGQKRPDIVSRKPVEIPAEMLRIRRNHTYERLFAEGIRQATVEAIEGSADVLGEESAKVQKLWRPAAQARKWVLNEFPLLGPLAAQLKVIADSRVCERQDIAIAAVNPYLGEVYFNPDRALSDSDVRFVYVHELLHVALMHHTREQGRDHELWNIACDFVINGWLLEMGIGTLPQVGGLFDPRLKGMGAEEVYDLILREWDKKKRPRGFRGKLGDIIHDGGGRKIFKDDILTLDDIYKRCMASGLNSHQYGRGLTPAGLIEEIRSLFTPPVPWDVELAHWMDAHVPLLRDPMRTYARASRRQASTPDIPRPARYIPQEWKEACTFGVVLDTSGSMDRQLLGRALGAIASYAEARDVPAVRLILCDAQPYDRGVINPTELRDVYSIQGRGGTVLQPALNYLVNQRDFPVNAPIMILTDGWCEEEILCQRDHCFLLPRKSWKEGSLPLRTSAPVFRVLKENFGD